MIRLVLASGNSGKVREFSLLLAGLQLEVISQRELGVASPPEDAATFVENAIIKARHASRMTGLAAFADDSGLAVDALGGEPGVRSARYAGSNASDEDNWRRLLKRMRELPDSQRGASFHCVLVLFRAPDDPVPMISHGRWPGQILRSPRGTGGFGYDPVFEVPELRLSAAELSAEEKNRRSHRANAVEGLLNQLRTEPGIMDSPAMTQRQNICSGRP
jgi:XTP/dITP diphosphohydrolase